MDGDGSLLPWQLKCEKLACLFRMCKKTNKALFVSGFGMQFLVYYCANGFQPLRVINGKEKGGTLKTIKDIDAKLL